MPHTNPLEQAVIKETKKPVKEGDLCNLFAQGALKVYNDKPSWSSIHKIKLALRAPYHTEWSHLLIQEYMTNWQKADIEVAADLAFTEFYRLVGSKYEDAMIERNGNCFATAILPEVKRPVGRPKKEEANG